MVNFDKITYKSSFVKIVDCSSKLISILLKSTVSVSKVLVASYRRFLLVMVALGEIAVKELRKGNYVLRVGQQEVSFVRM
jgi:hypothetical protein